MGYLDNLVHWYDMSVPVGLPDLGIPGGNDAVGANIVSNPNGVGGGICAEFNGNNSNYNCGDIVELNSVSAFTIAFWMNQDARNQIENAFVKRTDAMHNIYVHFSTVDLLYFYIADGVTNTLGYFNYSTVISAGQWHHVAVVYEGSGAANVDKLVAYVDGVPMTLVFSGTIPTATADLSGADAYIGHTANAFGGKFDEFMFLNTPLTNLQVRDLMLRTRRGLL